MARTMRNKRDTQRERIYEWEGKYLGPFVEEMSLSQIQQFISSILQDRNQNLNVALHPGKGCTSGSCASFWCWSKKTFDHVITLPKWCRNAVVVLHELAHVFHREICMKNKKLEAWHGPEWMGIYLELLSKYTDKSIEALVPTLAPNNISYCRRRISSIVTEEIIENPYDVEY